MQCKLIEHIATFIQARENCILTGNTEWHAHHTETLEELQQFLPSGSGFDGGSVIIQNDCEPDRIVITTSFHHMDENGFYDGWSDHSVIVKPSFVGLNIRVTGRDRNDIKDYITDAFRNALDQMIEHDANGFRLVVEQPELLAPLNG